ncbi:unnamed protein product [Fraxinus pennsylvanica]|uniref:BHLH domain-containing protein n=1 Tax=Fraxinus pennsylvanica TaxID=56036 RepID=A0AAD1ZPK8_9LAMI|nr:unnamed protein product [Fraxinus pennsylvanica]
MDSFDWTYSPGVSKNTSSTWSNQQHDVVQQLSPVLATGTHVNSNCRILLHQEAAKLGPGASWREIINAEMPCSTTPKNSLITADLGIESHPKTVSLDSLDCLLSTTTDTSVEDDGISKVFSDCKNSWNNFGTLHAVSSVASVSHVSNGKQEGNSHSHTNQFKETFSQTPTDQNANQPRSSSIKLYTTKRSSAQSELKESPVRSKTSRSDKHPNLSHINFQQHVSSFEPDSDAMAQMKEMIYRAAAFKPINLTMEAMEKPKRKNIRISTDPQTVAARQRRERISERFRVLQRLVPGGNKMDTASMLDEAANYLKFLRSQIKALEESGHSMGSVNFPSTNLAYSPFTNSFAMQTNFCFQNPNPNHHSKT